MAKTLSIYACSGIGDPEGRTINTSYDYWTDNTDAISNTQSVNTLLARINENAIEVLYLPLQPDEKIVRLNAIDFQSTILYYLNQYEKRPEQLVQLKYAVGKAFDDGLFEYASLSNTDRDLHLDDVIAKVGLYMDDENLPEPSQVFSKWWDTTIASRNKCVFTPKQQADVRNVLNDGKIGATDYSGNKELASYLNNAAEYFLYTYADDKQIAKLPLVFKKKRAIQRQVYTYCKNMYVGIYGSENDMKRVIRSGIIKTLGCTPEKAIESTVITYNQDVSGIGVIAEATLTAIKLVLEIVSIIASIMGMVYMVVKSICDAVAAVEATKQKQIDQDLIAAGNPNPEDYPDNSNKKKNGKYLIAGLILLFALLRK